MAQLSRRLSYANGEAYVSQLTLKVYHIQGIKNMNGEFIRRKNFDALIGTTSEALAREAFAHMDVLLSLNI